MKKLFFLKSSSSGNGSDNNNNKQLHRKKSSELLTSPKAPPMRSNSELSNGGATLTRSRSLSSSAFRAGNDHHLPRCITPEEAESSHLYASSTCSSNVSSHVLDRYIDGEEIIKRSSKQKIGSSSSSSSRKGSRRLPPRAKISSPLSDKPKFNGDHLNFSSNDDMRDVSARSLARSVVERLSHNNTHGRSSAYDDPITTQDVYGGYNGHEDSNSDALTELERRYKEAEKRVKLLSQELDFSDRDCDSSYLVGVIRQMEEERLGLAYEVLSVLRSQMDEREETRRSELHIKRLEKEKSELQFGLEKEIDRRSSEWTSKYEKFQMEEKRLRERGRELAEQNVSLQREVSTFHGKESERIDMIRELEETVTELNVTVEEIREENSYLTQKLSRLEESYSSTTEDLDGLRRRFEEKDVECKELHKSVTNLVRTCNEQGKTIQGLRDSFSEEEPSEKLKIELIRLVGVEFSLRKEVESIKVEADCLRRENRVKGNDKLDNEMKMRLCHLEEKALSMLNESTQLCYKLLKFIKERLTHKGIVEQFVIESEMRVHGVRRGTESLKRSLETVTSLLLEKDNEIIASTNDSPRSCSVEKSLRDELRAETLITSLLREKCYSMEQDIEQLQAEVAGGVRGNEVLQCEVRKTLDSLSINNHQLKDLNLQVVKKDEKINRLEFNLHEAVKDLTSMKVTLPKVVKEREQMWKEVKESRERNIDLGGEKETLKKKVEKLEEDLLFKEGQISILKDTLGSKHFDLLSSPEFSFHDFLVQ